MKIGIITFHNALNAGAILQAYALQTFLTQLGHTVEFIDYAPSRKYTLRNYIAKSPIAMLKKWLNIYHGKKYMKYGNYNKILTLSPNTYKNYEELKKCPPEYDIYIAGSDQIWNFYTSLSPAYMLDFVPLGKKKISYAASMGQCRIDKSLYEDFKTKLKSFNAISLREKNGVDFVNTLFKGEKLAHQTLDPTLLIDTNYYYKIIDNVKVKPEHYICTYILAKLDKENSEIINSIKSRLKLNIINVRNPDTCIWLTHAQNTIVTPYKWLYFIKNSDFVICCSFHAVVFSLIFHKPFIAIIPPIEKNKGGNMRINSLLNEFELTNRIISHYDHKLIEKTIMNNIDWNFVDNKIKILRKSSIDFLLEQLH